MPCGDSLMPKLYAKLGKVEVGDGYPTRIIGAMNLSPESFYAGSVVRSAAAALRKAEEMVAAGACIIDVGAMGTGPTSEPVSIRVELSRILPVIRALSRELDVPISIDTQRSRVAEEAVTSGAEIINDVSGLKGDPRMAEVTRKYGCSLIAMATEREPGDVFKISSIKHALRESLRICVRNKISLKKVVLDPAIGAWPARLKRLKKDKSKRVVDCDLRILANLEKFRTLRQPICVGISRKSFIGKILKISNPSERLIGSLAATAIAVFNGVHVIRTHDPAETAQTVKIAEAIRKFY